MTQRPGISSLPIRSVHTARPFLLWVRHVEAWLLADRERISAFLGVGTVKVPRDPETLEDPTRTLVDLARQSRRRDIREDMVPRPGSGRSGSARKRFLADGSSSIGSFGRRSRARRDVSCKYPIIHAFIDRWFASISSPFQAGVSGKDFASNLLRFRL